MRILVTGAEGQLGREINALAVNQPELSFRFTDHQEVDITDIDSIASVFAGEVFDVCINCAAFTAVDLAESQPEEASLVNATGARLLAGQCYEADCKLIHISTDFVFDGNQSVPYKEADQPAPLGVYGLTKYEGEQAVIHANPGSIVIRTSWLYSSFGKNFVKTIARLSAEREELGVVYDQIGAPTYAADLAGVVIKTAMKSSSDWRPGIYHYSNEGVASWYDFAFEIVELLGNECRVKAIESWQYPTAAKRPNYTVLNKKKIKEYLGVDIPHWTMSLRKCMDLLSKEQQHA